MGSISSGVRRWLVEHRTVSQFEWREGQTWGASPQFLLLTVLAYLSATALLHFASTPAKSSSSSSSSILRLVSAAHNLILLVLSLVMVVGCTLSAVTQAPDARWIFCFPPDGTPPRGPVFFWAYVFYLSKMLEFVDTLLILLSGSSKRLTFLHVYHHAVVVVMCYLWLHTSQSLLPVALVTNASVHTLMYSYYMMCSLGRRPPWKRAVTDCQIVQFVFGFAVSVVMLWFHFTGNGCSGIRGWCFNAAFNASLLALFLDFHSTNYAMRGRMKDEKIKGA